MGCEIHHQHRDETIHFTLLKAGNQNIELLKFLHDQKERKEGVISHIAFAVDDIVKEINRLRDLGVKLVTDQPREVKGGMKIFWHNSSRAICVEDMPI